jgi:hypothetical protein
MVPHRKIEYRGKTFEDMDTNGKQGRPYIRIEREFLFPATERSAV